MKTNWNKFRVNHERFKEMFVDQDPVDRERVFADVLDKKEAFKDYKKKCLRKRQN